MATNFGYIGNGQWKGRLTGHTFDSQEAHDHHERLEAMKLRRPTVEQEELDKLPPEQLRALVEGMMGATAENEGLAISSVELDVFLSRNPWYRNDKHNADQMNAYVKTHNMHPPYRCEDLESAANELREVGTLHLNQEAVEREQRAEIEGRLAKRKEFDEDEAYTLSMGELEKRARGSYIL